MIFMLPSSPQQDRDDEEQYREYDVDQDVHRGEFHGIVPGGIVRRSLCKYGCHIYIANQGMVLFALLIHSRVKILNQFPRSLFIF